MDDDEARTIGQQIRRVRKSRDKSLRVIAGLAGMGRMTLQRIEIGERAPTLSEITRLAGALEIAPSELTKLPVPAPANGPTDSARLRRNSTHRPPWASPPGVACT